MRIVYGAASPSPILLEHALQILKEDIDDAMREVSKQCYFLIFLF